jgi:hypothetical protein
MSQALMFTFLPDNLGSSNVIKLAMTQFLYSVCCAPWKNRTPPHTHTQNYVVLTGNMNCSVSMRSSNVIKLAMYFTQFLYSLPSRLMGAYVLCMVLVNN